MMKKVKNWRNGLRRTPMKCTPFKSSKPTPQKARKRMRNNTKERAKKDRAVQPDRDAFLEEFPTCWNCRGWPTCCDEIVSGMSNRSVGVQFRLAWTSLCQRCNAFELNGSAHEVLVKKLALKWINDRPHFDLPMVNVMRGRRPGAITMAEVIPTICRLLDVGRAV